MKYKNYIRMSLLAMAFGTATSVFTACEDDIVISNKDNGKRKQWTAYMAW